MSILSGTARDRFVLPGEQRSRLVHACYLRQSYSLCKVSYPPGQAGEKGQGCPPSAWSASSPASGACGRLKIAMYCVRARGRISCAPRQIAAYLCSMLLQAIYHVKEWHEVFSLQCN